MMTRQLGVDDISREVAAMVAAWERGERITAQEILDRHPELGDEAAIRLIYEETSLRREAGLDVDTAEVVGRYPRWAEDLRALFDCDRLIRSPGAVAVFPEVGEALGPFLLLDELGRGAAGRTYLATDPTLADRPVVVKVIPDDQDEHLALARLRHTHIVPLFSEHAFPEQGLRGLCMPFLGGTSLAQILDDLSDVPLARRSGKLLVEVIDRNTTATPATPPAEGPFRRTLEQASYIEAMIWITSCLADALHYAHARGLVHMDIKPSNVLITVDGQPMLLDFHLARGPLHPGEWITDRIGGTPGWMSPEQEALMDAVVAGRPVQTVVDGRTDIYALGLLLGEAIGATRRARDGRATVRRPVGMSLGLTDILQKCLAPDPRDRYGDAATLAEDLRRELNSLPLRGVRNRSPRERLQKWRSRHPGALAWAVTGVVVATAAILAAAGSITVYRQHLGRLQVALEDGRRDRMSGHYAEAIRSLQRGLQSAGTFPGLDEPKKALVRELRLSERGELAEELHALADRIRFRHGVDLPSDDDARSLSRLCRTLWERRSRLLPPDGPSLANGTEAQIRTDLLELAVVWADLRLRLATPDESDRAKGEAREILDQAESSFGPSFAIDARRAQLDAPDDRPPDRRTPRAPKSAWEHYDLGRYELRSGRIEAASVEFARTLDLRPQDFWSNFYQGLCAFRLRRFDDAVAAFQASIALAPDSAICHYNRARAYDALGRSDDARRGYTRAIELDPRLSASRLNRGILSYKSGRHAEAIADFDAGLAAQPDRETRGRLHFNLALAQLAQHDRRSALANAEKAMLLGCPEAIPLRDELR